MKVYKSGKKKTKQRAEKEKKTKSAVCAPLTWDAERVVFVLQNMFTYVRVHLLYMRDKLIHVTELSCTQRDNARFFFKCIFKYIGARAWKTKPDQVVFFLVCFS